MDKVCNGIDPRWFYPEIIPNLRHPEREVHLGFGTTPTGRRENYRVKLHQNEQGETIVERVDGLYPAISIVRFLSNCYVRDKQKNEIRPLFVTKEMVRPLLLKLRSFGFSGLYDYALCAMQLGLLKRENRPKNISPKIPNRTRKKQRLTRLRRRAKRQKGVIQ